MASETVKTATSGFNGIVDGIASSIGKVPKTAKGAADSLKSTGNLFKNLGDAIVLPFSDLKGKIAPSFADLGLGHGRDVGERSRWKINRCSIWRCR